MKTGQRGLRGKYSFWAAFAGAVTALFAVFIIGLVCAHAMEDGIMSLVDEEGEYHTMTFTGGLDDDAWWKDKGSPAADKEEETAAPSFTDEELALLNEKPEETEEELTPEPEPEPEPPFSLPVEEVQELVLQEAIHVENRTQADPFFTMGIGTDDVITREGPIPNAYDANVREDGGDVITDVRNQGSSHLCWAYAALGAVEANLLVKHPTLGVDRLDLSEKHLAWYALTPATGSVSGLIDNDYRQIQGVGDDASQTFFQSGLAYIMATGVTDYIFSALGAWKGPVDDVDVNSFNRQKNGRITIEDQGPPSDAYGTAYHVQGIYEVSGAAYNRDAIKKMILEYGAVTCSVHADQTSGNSYWYLANLYDGAPYGENNNLADHEVLVTGWDDAYETDNFQPESTNPGAWHCRNSWGATAGEEGYFWLSYDDVIFQNNNVAAYNVVLRGDPDYYDKNYQVASNLTHISDMMIDQNNVVYAYTASQNPYGVLYTAESDETLAAVGLYSLETENEYELGIFMDPATDGVSMPAEAITAPYYTQTVFSASGGYHTYALSQEIPLSAGQSFLVTVTPKKPSKLVYEKTMIATGDANYDEDNNYIGNVYTSSEASGRSYYLSADGTQFESQADKDFFIKAFTRVQ